jgi:hypothetical protein
MWASLLALVPFKDRVYAAVIVALLIGFGWYTVHERRIGAAHELEAVAKENARVIKAAQEHVDALNKQYEAALNAAQEKYDADLETATHQRDADIARLRRAAANKGNPVLPGPGATTGKPDTGGGPESPDGLGNVFVRALVSLDLANALRIDDSLLSICRDERNSLTGK